MNSYKCSDGSRLKKSVIDSLIKKAKAQKLRQQFDESGYNFCEICGISNGTYLDCSHVVSVKECQETGKTELAFHVDNIKVLCRDHHNKHDKTGLQWKGLT